jgi:hypothetical protein
MRRKKTRKRRKTNPSSTARARGTTKVRTTER